MEKEAPSSLFVNDGSFMERFKQLQQEKAKDTCAPSGDSKQSSVGSRSSNPSATKTHLDCKANNSGKSSQPLSGGKLAFSLKQKSKLVAPPVKLAADEDEDDADARSNLGDTSVKRQKLIKQEAYEKSSGHDDVGKYHFMNIILCGQDCDGRLLFGSSFLSRNGMTRSIQIITN